LTLTALLVQLPHVTVALVEPANPHATTYWPKRQVFTHPATWHVLDQLPLDTYTWVELAVVQAEQVPLTVPVQSFLYCPTAQSSTQAVVGQLES
jgi:hypothetical protein